MPIPTPSIPTNGLSIELNVGIQDEEKLALLRRLQEIHNNHWNGKVENVHDNYVSAYLPIDRPEERKIDPMWRNKVCDRFRHLIYRQDVKHCAKAFTELFEKPSGMSETEFEDIKYSLKTHYSFISAYAHGDQKGAALNLYNTEIKRQRPRVDTLSEIEDSIFEDTMLRFENALLHLIKCPIKQKK